MQRSQLDSIQLRFIHLGAIQLGSTAFGWASLGFKFSPQLDTQMHSGLSSICSTELSSPRRYPARVNSDEPNATQLSLSPLDSHWFTSSQRISGIQATHLNSTQLGSNQLNAAQLSSAQPNLNQLGATQPNSTQRHSAQPSATLLNSTLLDATWLNPTQLNSSRSRSA